MEPVLMWLAGLARMNNSCLDLSTVLTLTGYYWKC